MEQLNTKSNPELREALTRCCGATNWVESLLAQKPYASSDELHAKAKRAYQDLETADYLEAFTHHPKIGGDLAKLREKFATTADWSGNEQAAVSEASEAVLQRLAAGNDAYFEKFGYIFIVCATGKSAAEMLALLEARLPNDPADEIKIAADEQEKILEIRLNKLLEELA
ncbi:MAG: 2-oxo-4-hydroxy-4-carboxy-5-ureidoimidazoline decarboxylase [Anaerolineae bacterium]